jgi:uracil-xanthine permease
VANGFGAGAEASSLAVACLVLVSVISLCAIGTPLTRTLSVLAGLVVGYVASALLGHFPVPPHSSWFVVPIPAKYGLSFKSEFVLPMLFLYVITALETLGDLTATSQLSGLPVEGPDYWKRIRGGVLADSLNSLMAALLCSFPTTTYAQNNGIIQITGVASRRVGYIMAGLLIFCGFIPAVGNWVAVMPQPVLGGMTLLLFGYVAAGGLRILYYSQIQQREWLIIAVSLGIGVGMGAHPEVVNCLPGYLQNFLQSSVVAGGMAALLLNAILPKTNVTLDPLMDSDTSL